jgi:hypothetical protein
MQNGVGRGTGEQERCPVFDRRIPKTEFSRAGRWTTVLSALRQFQRMTCTQRRRCEIPREQTLFKPAF